MMSQSTRHSLVMVAAATLGLLGCNAEGEKTAAPASGPVVEAVGQAKADLKAAQVCISIRRGAEGNCADAMINEEPSSVSNNYGALALLHNGISGGTQRRSLYKWDLSPVPAGANILSAGLTFSMSSTAAATMRLHLVKVPWTENTVSWQSFNNGFNAGVLASFSNGFPAASTASVSVLAAVKDWVSGAAPNHGVLLEQQNAGLTSVKSSEFQVASARPKLSVCYQITCDPGFADCDGNGKNGCEASLNAPTSCGACGVVCSFPHAAATCPAGACALGACDAGFADCDGNALNGCETPTSTMNNCGGCGVACDDGNTCTSESCATGACVSTPVADGTPCNDGNACTQTDSCQVGACAGASPVVCAAQDVCHAAGACDPQSGQCSNPPQACCFDGVQNQGEAGVDCGGSCAACPPTCSAEVCDGLDSDCDGIADNGDPGGNAPCNSGPCGPGLTHCQDGALTCVPNQQVTGCTAPPVVIITTPTDGSVAANPTVQVTGTLSAPATVTVGEVTATVNGLSFSATVPVHEGTNILTAAAKDAAGSTGVASVTVLRDTTPPRLTILSPADNATINGASVTVVGMVQDLLLGTVDAGDVTVTVNGVAAEVANRGFRAMGVPVAKGAGTITVIATDKGGNTASALLSVTGNQDAKAQILVESGDGQTAAVGTVLPQLLTAHVVNNAGAGVPGASVTFTVTRGNGTFAGGARTVTIPSSGAGLASVSFKLGTHAGAAMDLVEARSTGFVGTATFAAIASASPGPRKLQAINGLNQRVLVASASPLPLSILLTDSFGNPVANQSVTFTVLRGGGRVNGAEVTPLMTDADGHAYALFTAGGLPGINSQLVRATFPGSGPVHFVASTVVAGPPEQTAISGVIQTNENAPIANVLVRIRDTALQVLTNAEGRWSIVGAPVGRIHLIVDGTTAGPYPPLSFERDLLSGVDNSMDRPVYLPLVDEDGMGIANPTSDVELRRADTPGLVFTVPAGSATFLGASPKIGAVQVVRVHNDKIPMTPPDGTLPSIALAIMPADAHFDPPAPIRFPNVEGRSPGEIVTIYSYDHDLGEFVGVGTATVSEDGLSVVSGPGQGIVKGGWHLVPPVAPLSGDLSNNTCENVRCDCAGNCNGFDVNSGNAPSCSYPHFNPSSFFFGPVATPDVDCYTCPVGNFDGNGVLISCEAPLPLDGTDCARGFDPDSNLCVDPQLCNNNGDCASGTCSNGVCKTGTCHVAVGNNPLHLAVCCPTFPVDCWQPGTETCECP